MKKRTIESLFHSYPDRIFCRKTKYGYIPKNYYDYKAYDGVLGICENCGRLVIIEHGDYYHTKDGYFCVFCRERTIQWGE